MCPPVSGIFIIEDAASLHVLRFGILGFNQLKVKNCIFSLRMGARRFVKPTAYTVLLHFIPGTWDSMGVQEPMPWAQRNKD